jgi:predicted Zn-dependent protease
LGENALISMRHAYLPVLFAVLILAAQLTFWQHAVAASGEMLNVLVFAFIINGLLEYRVSQHDNWLLVSAFVYGLGASNNWALLGFFPCYLIALLWIRGLPGFFNFRFLGSMFLCGLAGLLLYGLIPILGSMGATHEGFLYILGRELGAQSFGLRLVPHWLALVAAVPTILPLIFAAIKWPTFEGELSVFGAKLTRFLFSLLHVAFLALALVTFFDFKYSPSLRMREQPISFLTFYYAAALCIGYFSGYILLVYGSSRPQSRDRRGPLLKFFNRCVVLALWAVCIGAPALLVWQNFPHIRAAGRPVLQQFADRILEGLPAKKAIILSDDSARLYLLQAECERRGVARQYILIDTEAFPHREYLFDLASRYPELKKVMTTNMALLPKVLPSENLSQFMYLVTRDYPVYYMHPSFGYYFEALYLKPHGLVYEVKPYTTNLTQPPLQTEAEIKANQLYWAKLESGPLKSMPESARLDADAEAVSVDYAVALDYWATELQKAGHLNEAHDQFVEALRLNTNNFIATINLEYNERLLKGDHRPIDSTEAFFRNMYLYHGLARLFLANGPADEPGLDLVMGEVLAEGGNLNQASILFQRRLQLLPGDPDAEMAMAKTYVDLREPAKSLEMIRKLRGSPKIGAWELARCEALAHMVNKDFALAEKVLRNAIQADPNDANRIATLAEFYRVRGLDFGRERKEAEANRAFENALTNIDLQLKLLANSSRDTAASVEIPETLLKKAEVQTMLRAYAATISTLSQVLEIQPNNYTALMNRAVAEIQIKQFQAAKDDFKALGKLLPRQPYLVDFGLADVASAEENKAQEIEHLKRCIKSAPAESNEYRRATNRLAVLERH